MKITRPASGRAARISPGELEHIGHASSARHGALAGALDHGSIGERIAERHAQLDHIRARIDRGKRNGARGLHAGIAGGEINDQARLVIETECHVIG